MAREEKPIEFCGDSLDRLRAFPQAVKQDMGYQIGLVQAGLEPEDSRPMKTVGNGVYEIRVKDETGAYRTFYIAKRQEAIYILHCFQKKTEKTAPKDLALGKQRFKELPPEPSKSRQ
ncbi:type II toxin-antitoxin system RelE/ParE family toxin [Salinicola sp. V024]|uniref:type II toxin-antitoxin system RelE/ParE family toxin n=1 Tax=Salinicola sp. V024 TaxID=3459609 RepID=UPI0040439C6C